MGAEPEVGLRGRSGSKACLGKGLFKPRDRPYQTGPRRFVPKVLDFVQRGIVAQAPAKGSQDVAVSDIKIGAWQRFRAGVVG